MSITKLVTGNTHQIEVAYRTVIIFDDVNFINDGELTFKNRGVFSGAIYDPDSIEQFKIEWSKING